MAISGNSSTGFSIALSGLNDARLRLDVAAHNIANANTDNFAPQRVVSQALPDGGVTATTETQPPPPKQPPPPGNMNPNFLFPSQTDLVGELVNTILGQQAFEASAQVLSTQAESSKTLIDAFG